MENNTNLYIPVKIKMRFEFFAGFGLSELVPTIVVSVISAIAASVFHGITGGNMRTKHDCANVELVFQPKLRTP